MRPPEGSKLLLLEKQQTDVKHRTAEFDSAITAHFNDDAHVLIEGGGGNTAAGLVRISR